MRHLSSQVCVYSQYSSTYCPLSKEAVIGASDRFHPVVNAALMQDGWIVTRDPLQIKV